MKPASPSGSILRYHVVHCSSEVEEHPSSELHSFNAHSQGWQSARASEYPINLIVQFEGDVRLRRIKLLSHEYKIASKVELFMGALDTEAAETQEVSWKQCSFKRVGYLTLSPNEENSFNARELKRVKLDISCCFMKFLFYRNHDNRKNIFNQVGVVAIQFLGDLLSSFPHTVLGPLSDPRTSTPKDMSLEDMRPQKTKPDAPDAYLDEETRSKIEELNKKKQIAVTNEDFILAKEIKDHIEHLKRCSAQLYELQKQKQIAVEKEDYELAHKLKEEIKRVQETMGNWKTQHNLEDRPLNIRRGNQYEFEVPQTPPHSQFPEEVRTSSPPTQESHSEDTRLPRDQEQQRNEISNIPHDEKPVTVKNDASKYFNALKEEDGPNTELPDKPLQRKKRGVPLSKNHDDAPVSALSNATIELEVLEDNTHLKPKDERYIPGFLEKELSGKPDWERDLILQIMKTTDFAGAPDPLPKHDDYSEIILVFGSFATRCLLSSTSRALREGALNVISERLGTLPSDRPDLAIASLKYMKIGIQDKIPAVYLASLHFMREVLKFCGKSVKKNQIAPLVDPVLTSLMAKMADANSRIKEQTGRSLLFLCGRACIGAAAVCQNCLKIPTKDLNGWKPIASRLNLLTQLVPKYGFTEKSSLTTLSVWKLVALGLDNANIEARKAAMELFIEMYKLDSSVLSFVEVYEKSKPLLHKEIMSMLQNVPVYNSDEHPEISKQSPKQPSPAEQEKLHLEPLSFAEIDLENLVLCDFCEEPFPNEQYINYHWAIPLCKLLTPCPLCGEVLLMHELNSHLIDQCYMNDKVEPCETCGDAVIKKERHIHKNSGLCKPLSRGVSFRCPQCKEHLQNEQQFTKHLVLQCLNNERLDIRKLDPNFVKWIQFCKEKGITSGAMNN